jgi:hypothetical protein
MATYGKQSVGSKKYYLTRKVILKALNNDARPLHLDKNSVIIGVPTKVKFGEVVPFVSDGHSFGIATFLLKEIPSTSLSMVSSHNAEGDDSAFNRGRYYNADGTARPNLTLKSEVQKGDIPNAGIGKGIEINNAKSDSIVDTVKNKTSEYATLVKNDKAYTGLALGILSGLGVAFYVNKKKHYGIAGYVGIALAGGAVGYFAGKAVKGGGLASVAGASGSKDSQIESKINSLIDKADANADKLDLKNNKTGKKVTPAEIAEGKEKIKKVLPVLLAKMTDREKDMALDFLALASTFLDKAIAEISKGAKFNPMMMLGFIAQATDELGKKYSEKELKDFMEKTQSLAS